MGITDTVSSVIALRSRRVLIRERTPENQAHTLSLSRRKVYSAGPRPHSLSAMVTLRAAILDVSELHLSPRLRNVKLNMTAHGLRSDN